MRRLTRIVLWIALAAAFCTAAPALSDAVGAIQAATVFGF